MQTMSTIPEPVRNLLARLIESRPMRRGSVSDRYVKCNKAGCPCATDPAARHGPYVSLVRVVAGKTVSRWVSTEQAALLRRQVEAGQEFRRLVEAYWRACEQWADAELDQDAAASKEAAKKGASKSPSRRKSSGKSKPSSVRGQ